MARARNFRAEVAGGLDAYRAASNEAELRAALSVLIEICGPIDGRGISGILDDARWLVEVGTAEPVALP